MIVGEARIETDLRNVEMLRQPQTEHGQEPSRANALKQGLCSSIVVREDVELIQQRSSDWFDSLKPQNDYQCWLVDHIALLSIRINRSERIERRVRDRKSLRAELCWDDDRRLDAASLGGMIHKRPEEVVEELRRTPQGCEWLMTRWAMLAHTADVNGSWTSEQTHLAFDLLATPAPFREGTRPGALLDFEGRLIDSADDPAAVARREIASLKARREIVAGLDEVNRSLAMADLNDEDDPELKRLRRYEATLHRRLRWCLTQLHFKSPHPTPLQGLRPRWNAQPDREPKPAPKPESEAPKEVVTSKSLHPPFDLEPDEFPAAGEVADIPAILVSRREKAFQKSENRRDSLRRKIDRLRA